MVPHIILVTCAKKISQFGGPNGGAHAMEHWHNIIHRTPQSKILATPMTHLTAFFGQPG